MLTSISPLGERGRGQRWGITVAAFVAGSTLGGATIGALAGLISPGRMPLAAAAACALAGAADVTGRLPHGSRQVDEDWLTRYRGWVYGVGFGYQLGLGVVTIVTSASTYAVLAVALFSGSLPAGLAIGSAFGLVRSLPLLLRGRANTAQAVRVAARRRDRAAGAANRVTVLTLVAAAVALLAGAAA